MADTGRIGRATENGVVRATQAGLEGLPSLPCRLVPKCTSVQCIL